MAIYDITLARLQDDQPTAYNMYNVSNSGYCAALTNVCVCFQAEQKVQAV